MKCTVLRLCLCLFSRHASNTDHFQSFCRPLLGDNIFFFFHLRESWYIKENFSWRCRVDHYTSLQTFHFYLTQRNRSTITAQFGSAAFNSHTHWKKNSLITSLVVWLLETKKRNGNSHTNLCEIHISISVCLSASSSFAHPSPVHQESPVHRPANANLWLISSQPGPPAWYSSCSLLGIVSQYVSQAVLFPHTCLSEPV